MYKATELIRDELISRGMDDNYFQIYDTEEFSAVILPLPIENGPISQVILASSDDENDVSVRTGGILAVSADKRDSLRRALESVNAEYRYLKFVPDEDGDVCAQYDFPMMIPDEAVGPIAFELVTRILQIVNDVYPKLMQALFS